MILFEDVFLNYGRWLTETEAEDKIAEFLRPYQIKMLYAWLMANKLYVVRIAACYKFILFYTQDGSIMQHFYRFRR